MHRRATAAYESNVKATASSRELEAAALYKGARMLEACQRDWESPERPARLEEALRFNQRLWTLFQTELSRPDHGLPLQLRVNLLRLSEFVDRRTFQLMARATPDKLQVLIDIDRN